MNHHILALISSMLYLQMIWIILILLTQISCSNEVINQSEEMEHYLELLAKVQQDIERRTSKNNHLSLKISRLFEHSIKHNEVNLTINDISLLPSISVPYKDNIYYSMLLKRKNNIYTLRGSKVIQQLDHPILISTLRNQHTYFAEFMSNSTIKISKLKIMNKKTHIQFSLNVEVVNNSDIKFDYFIVSSLSANKFFIFASSASKKILIFQKNGTLSRQITTIKSIKQMRKINNNLLILTEDQLFFLNMNKQFNKTTCILPYGSIQSFQHDESNLKYIYGISNDSIYQFQLYSHCRPIKKFLILPNSTFTVTGQIIFLSNQQIKYAINKTTGQSQLYSFPFSQCLGDKKIEINRKMQSNYIVSQICLGQNQINMTHILIQFEDTLDQVTDFSKFRIPLLFFSFGIIIYVTVKNKNKNKPDQDDEKALQQKILRQMATLHDKGSTKSTENLQNTQKQEPIFEKKPKRN